MKPVRPKAERDAAAIERGIGAERLLQDEAVSGWFANTEHTLIREMLTAEIGDDQKRRDCAVKVQLLRDLKQQLTTNAALGRKTREQSEKEKHG